MEYCAAHQSLLWERPKLSVFHCCQTLRTLSQTCSRPSRLRVALLGFAFDKHFTLSFLAQKVSLNRKNRVRILDSTPQVFHSKWVPDVKESRVQACLSLNQICYWALIWLWSQMGRRICCFYTFIWYFLTCTKRETVTLSVVQRTGKARLNVHLKGLGPKLILYFNM